VVKDDFSKLPGFLEEAKNNHRTNLDYLEGKQPEFEEETSDNHNPEQLSLF
jgi:hypothetical protein